MAICSLTKRTLDAVKPAEKDQFLWDSVLSGFGAKVTPAGRRVFLIQYRMGGRVAKTKRYTIGTYGSPWTPSQARAEAERLLIKVKQGIDPGAEKHERRHIEVDFAFSTYVERFLTLEVKPRWKTSHKLPEGILRNHVAPFFKSKPLPNIRKADVTALFDQLPSTQKALRRNTFTVLRRLFRWAKGRGDIEANPLEGFEAPPPPPSRDRTLKDDELRLAWLAADQLGYPFGPFFRLLMGTGQRRNEVGGLDWRELDRSSAEWTLPRERAKNNVATTIHLSPPMIALLDTMAGGTDWPRKGLVFSTNGKTQVSGYSKAKARLDREMLKLARKEAQDAGKDPHQVEGEEWKVHDLRRTLGTGMQRLGVRFEVIEAILNHLSGSKAGVAGVYQRHDWNEEKKAALDAWAAHIYRLTGAVDASNVVPLRAAS